MGGQICFENNKAAAAENPKSEEKA